MAQQKAKRKNALLLILLIMSVGGLSGWQITRSTGFLSKKTVSLARTQPEQFTLIGTCNQEACLFKSGTTVLGTATLRGYYKTTEGKIENYIKGGSGGKEIVNTKNEFIVVSKTLSRDAVPLLEYLVPESINSTEDNVDIKISTTDLGAKDKRVLTDATEDKPAEIKVQSHTPARSGGGPFARIIYMDLLSVK
ncbi:MAG: hypothetical protein A2700_01180 [Candidatus Blackburnbacteria bacterium RIFCSPHIGHO2_01_FULL_44_64]|uniref:Uncharacterized protein n=1 Tax=Candidatus Blackburnbacteria bacterium RIFCSPHIGHO2_02_FULL_44_20 TaxID=1797516 RepID=A0A1G1V8Z9_9BACT|nr:MAG: hypothetical protein A2700_01180 [Candidatus Blackburnbacteria bacterium RIFCSPHIGHO2_01_FULL_44_64]OGY11584.1 MAG: hypothetical protein A3E16_04525 [Candidatus Blackburnbacteria bacterium RIFCSPHIGHO2_12_FULL_44_25]OGY11682.1 MAG: hypothetical protein A3D26_01040 [Candidatus Blackburnbacteria bacterium RIFCSPHIGHO2_02_FULL_44_20]OGY14392.1 MAG: hypothetical protein A3A62_03525 [Candidatus Blackburnbacteria bacterium RIFCSPLOWO2_01_FULL_44_43]